jgi:hypothetical protein
MKNNLKLMSLICGIALSTCFVSCKDDATTSVPVAALSANMQNITKAPWKIRAYRAKENDDAWVDFMTVFPSCYLDNTYTFSKDGVVVMDEGPTKCDPDDVQSETMSWGFFENEKKIVFLSDDGPGTILALDANNLKILYEIDEGGDKIKMTYSH